MKLKTLRAVAVAGAFAAPFAAQASAENDRSILAQAGSGAAGGAAAGGGAATGGADSSTSSQQQGATPPGTPSAGAQTPATGAAGAGAGAASFDSLDKNGDGYVSRDEAQDATQLNTRFSELDKDNDGKLSRSEMQAMESGAGGTGATGSGTRR